MKKTMRTLLLIIWVIAGLWSLGIGTTYIYALYGGFAAVISVMVLPISYFITPFVIGFMFGNWSPVVLLIVSMTSMITSSQFGD